MFSERATRRGAFCTKLALGLGGAMLLLVTPGAAAPGAGAIRPSAMIAIQEATAVNVLGVSGWGCSCIHIPPWPQCRSPWKPPWVPGPPPWVPGPPVWVPRPPWVPGPPVWIPSPPPWVGW